MIGLFCIRSFARCVWIIASIFSLGMSTFWQSLSFRELCTAKRGPVCVGGSTWRRRLASLSVQYAALTFHCRRRECLQLKLCRPEPLCFLPAWCTPCYLCLSGHGISSANTLFSAERWWCLKALNTDTQSHGQLPDCYQSFWQGVDNPVPVLWFYFFASWRLGVKSLIMANLFEEIEYQTRNIKIDKEINLDINK